MEQLEEPQRNSSLELLRIISMILIVVFHYPYHGFGVLEHTHFNRYFLGVLVLWGKLGVDCFVLISGYFMVDSKFTLKKFLRLEGQVLFYSVLIGVIFSFFLPSFSTGRGVKWLFPVLCREYWFMTDFIILMLLSPALNLLISKMTKEFHRNLLIGITLFGIILPLITQVDYGFGRGSGVVWFVALYFYAAYIKKYVNIKNNNANKHFLIATISGLLLIATNMIMIRWGHIHHHDIENIRNQLGYHCNSPLIVLTSVELLIGFVKLKPFYNRWINVIASASLGVYLIHDNNFVRPFLWKTLLKTSEMYSSHYLILHAIASILGVYLVCTLIDLIRKNTVGKYCVALEDRYHDTLVDRATSIVEKGCRCVKRGIERFYR
jgi:surface polysaccharide O-acyltransferase-like enzyme